MKRPLMLGVIFVFALSALHSAREARADSRGEALVKKADAALTKAKDQLFNVDMVIDNPGKDPRTLKLEVHVKGSSQRRIHFTAPGDVKGLKILIRSRSQMYVYLPAYRKIRRVASHVRAQSMFGADYNYDDMSTVTYGNVFAPRFVKETKTHWLVEGKRRAGQESPYAKVRLRIRKDNHMPDELVYFNEQGKKIKTETRSKFKCKSGVCTSWLMKMVDHTRNGHWTKLVMTMWKVDTGFSDRVFSLRRLQRGR